MTQSDLAAPINVTYQQIQRYERGQSRISVSTLALIANTLDVSLDYFLQGIEVNAPAGATKALETLEGLEIAAIVSGIGHPALQLKLLAIVRQVAEIYNDLQLMRT